MLPLWNSPSAISCLWTRNIRSRVLCLCSASVPEPREQSSHQVQRDFAAEDRCGCLLLSIHSTQGAAGWRVDATFRRPLSAQRVSLSAVALQPQPPPLCFIFHVCFIIQAGLFAVVGSIFYCDRAGVWVRGVRVRRHADRAESIIASLWASRALE